MGSKVSGDNRSFQSQHLKETNQWSQVTRSKEDRDLDATNLIMIGVSLRMDDYSEYVSSASC